VNIINREFSYPGKHTAEFIWCNCTERGRITAQVGFGQWEANVAEEKRYLAVSGCSECQPVVVQGPQYKQMPQWQVPSTFPACFPHLPPLTTCHSVLARPDARGITNLCSVATFAFTTGQFSFSK